MTTTTLRTRLEKDLLTASARLRQPDADTLDESWATRELLVERVKRLSDALDRIHDGSYGLCVECDEPLAPARLSAMPEVATCVRCQSGRERLDRQAGRSREALFALAGTD